MKVFVFWAGWLYIGGGFLFYFPRLLGVAGFRPSSNVFWTEVTGLLTMFLGLALALGARNLAARGAIVYWGAWTLAVVGVMEITFGLRGDLSRGMVASGVFDLAVGLLIVAMLPRHLGCGHADLALDRA